MLTGQADNEAVFKARHRHYHRGLPLFSTVLRNFPATSNYAHVFPLILPYPPARRGRQGVKRGKEKKEEKGKVTRSSALLRYYLTARRVKIKIVSFITFISFDASANGAHASAAVLPLGLLLGVQGNHDERHARTHARCSRTKLHTHTSYHARGDAAECARATRFLMSPLRRCLDDSLRAPASLVSFLATRTRATRKRKCFAARDRASAFRHAFSAAPRLSQQRRTSRRRLSVRREMFTREPSFVTTIDAPAFLGSCKSACVNSRVSIRA